MYYVFICDGSEYEQVMLKMKHLSGFGSLHWCLVNRQQGDVQFMELYENIVQTIDSQYSQHVGETSHHQVSRKTKLFQAQALFQMLHLYTYLPQQGVSPLNLLQLAKTMQVSLQRNQSRPDYVAQSYY